MPDHVCVHTPTAADQGKNAVLGTVASTVLNPLSYSTTDLLKRIGRASITRAWIFHAAALSARMHAVGRPLEQGGMLRDPFEVEQQDQEALICRLPFHLLKL